MEIILINGSPKVKESNSSYFQAELKQMLGNKHNIKEYTFRTPSSMPDLPGSISTCDELVFTFPLYVDGIPSHIIYLLEEIKQMVKSNHKSIKVYAMVNCGFYEGRQTKLSLQMMKNWCKKSGLIWCQGLGIGGGEMLGSLNAVPIGHGPKKSLGNELNSFSKSISAGTEGQNLYVSPNFPRFAFQLFAHRMWTASGKDNGLSKKDLLKN